MQRLSLNSCVMAQTGIEQASQVTQSPEEDRSPERTVDDII